MSILHGEIVFLPLSNIIKPTKIQLEKHNEQRLIFYQLLKYLDNIILVFVVIKIFRVK
jgi:hypothetical protein